MSTQPHSKETQMATTTRPTTDAPTLPTNTHPWPAFDREHDPEPLTENDPTETERTTLADFGGVEPSEPETVWLVTPSPLETIELDLESTHALIRYRNGDRPDQIADTLGTDCETVARRLRRAGVLRAFDDPRALAHLYHDHDHTLATLSETFDHARGPESIRFRMEKFGISRGETPAQRLASLDPEDVGLSPTTDDDSHSKFSKRGEKA